MTSFLRNASVQAYLTSLKSKSTEDPLSLCSLLTRKVSQSTNIRLGNELENIFNLYVNDIKLGEDIRPSKCAKGEHQKDFLRLLDGHIVYGEFKSNINLDTEKRKATIQKVLAVGRELAGEKEVRPYLVSLRHLRTADIPVHVASSYREVSLIGIGDLFRDVLKHDMEELTDYSEYSKFLMSIVDRLEPSSS